MIPRATLRLQFHRGFTFADAQALVPYFARLGISHLYASPIAAARPGSMHGYDVIDADAGQSRAGRRGRAARAARRRSPRAGLGLILDIVPNHMAADPANAWWADVLRHGRASRYARFFDIDWVADDKVLLPILGRPLEEALAAGELERRREERLLYFSHRLPLADGERRASLRDVLARQHYRLAWWRTRRRPHQLAALLRHQRAGLPAHGGAGSLRGGARLAAAPARRGADRRPAHRPCRRPRRSGRLLPQAARGGSGDEAPGWWSRRSCCAARACRADWGCDGTTGYDFMNEVSALQHDPVGRGAAGDGLGVAQRPAGRLRARGAGGAARDRGAQLLAPSSMPAAAAFRRGESRRRPTAASRAAPSCWSHFPVYRTYGGRRRLSSAADRAVLQRAADGARRRPALRPTAGRSIASCACSSVPPARLAVARFQQLSAPVAAKAVEDTAFYRYGRLLSRNDVGFDRRNVLASMPRPSMPACRRAPPSHPRSMLATATHDHKRGEDVRARLAVLSEMADEWAPCRRRWVAASKPLCTDGAPAPGDVAMLLQTVVGAWPLDLDRGDRDGRAAFAGRLAAWQQKALREAKLFSDWAAVDEAYEDAGPPLRPGAGRRGGAARPAGRDRGLRPPHRAGRRGQRPGAMPAAAHRARRARPLSGHRVLGFQPGRSRQPPAGRFCRALRQRLATATSAPWAGRGAMAASSRR